MHMFICIIICMNVVREKKTTYNLEREVHHMYHEAPLVTSGISRSAGAQSFGGAHRGRVYVRVFIGVSVCACCERLRCTVYFSKKF
jgi:hypothetical protein